MRKLTAQFKIENELLTALDGSRTQAEITEAVLQRLRNRTAIFDKIIEDDGDDDVEIQLHDQENLDAEGPAATMVDVTFSVNDEVLEKLEAESDLVFLKVISEIDNEHVKLKGDDVQNNVAHISYS
jgi:hypothetical protein